MTISTKQIDNISIRDILFIIFSKFHVMLGVIIIIISLGVLQIIRTKPIYEVYATILVKPFIDSTTKLIPVGGMSVRPVTVEELNTEIEIMKAREIKEQVAKEITSTQYDNLTPFSFVTSKKKNSDPDNLINTVVSYLKKNMKIGSVTASNIIEIKLGGSEPEEITTILNIFLKQYQKYRIRAYKTGGNVDFYSKQMRLFSENLKNSEITLKQHIKKWSVLGDKSQKAIKLDLLMSLKNKLNDLKTNLAEKRAKYNQIKDKIDGANDTLVLIDEFKKFPMLNDLYRGFIPLMLEAERIALLYPKSTVEYKDAFNQLATYKQEITEKRDQFLDGMLIEITSLEHTENILTDAISRIEAESVLLAEKELEYYRFDNKLKRYTKLYNFYLDKTEEARVAEKRGEAKLSNIFITNWAHKPSSVINPRKKRTVLVVIMVAMVSGIGCAFTAYYLDHTIKRPDDMIRHCQIPVLATLEIVDK